MAVGTHSVWAYPDPGAGGWAAPIASNPYFTSNGDGWRAIPFGAGFVWANGGMTSTNPTAAYQALGRDPLYPVARPAGATKWRVRTELVLPSPERVYLLARFGRTANDAFQTASGANAASLFTWRDLPAGRHRLEAVFSPTTQPDPAFTFMSPQVTVDPTTTPITIESLELSYLGDPGVDLSCLVDTVSINHGRNGPEGQPEASAATFELTGDAYAALPPGVDIGGVVVVSTVTTEGNASQRFTGRITDIALGWDDAGEDTPDAGVAQIVAVGKLADLGRRVVGDAPFPSELDGARVSRVLTLAGVTLDPLSSDPGTVSLLARDVDSQAALDVAHGAAESAAGMLWQTRGGDVRYADADHRRGIPSNLTLDACDVLVSPTWKRDLGGLVNSVSIGYGVTPEGAEQPRYVASSPTSIARYGTYGFTGETELAAAADASRMGNLLLARNAVPVWVMAALPVDTAGLDAARYDALLALDVHALVTLTGLPAIGTAPTSAALWVEGWRETLSYGVHEIELAVSGYCRTVPPPRWDDLPPALTWGGMQLTETRRNLAPNPSFETDDSGWAPWGAGTTTARQASASSPAGGSYLRCTCNDATNTGAATAVPATPGVRYGVRAMTRLNAALGVGVILQFLDAAGASIAVTNGPTTVQPTSTWALNTNEAVAPTGAVTLNAIVVRRVAGAAGLFLDVDAVAVYALPASGTWATTYFDGSTPDTDVIDYAWTGTAHASPSVQSDISWTGGVPPELTWDDAQCLGPPVNLGRWNDQPANLRWDLLAPTKTWDTYT